MIQTPTYFDLLACAVVATNGAHRRAACALLAREHVTRLAFAERQHQQVGIAHPVFADVPSADDTLAQLLGGSKPADEALAAARYLARCDREFAGGGAAYVQFAAPKLPAAAADAAASNANALAPALRALVVADVGSIAFAAARASFAEHFAGFETVPYAAFGVLADAAAGTAFRLNAHWGHPDYAGSVTVNQATRRELFVPGGTWNVNLHAVARSDGTGNPQSIALAIYVGETAVRTYTSSRASSNPAEFVEVGDFREFFRPGQADTITVSGGRVSVRNAGPSAQVAGGILTLWQA